MRLQSGLSKLFLLVVLGFGLANCSGVHTDDASLEVTQEDQQEDVTAYSDPQDGDVETDQAESEMNIDDQDVADDQPMDNKVVDQETEAELNDMLSRLSDEQEVAQAEADQAVDQANNAVADVQEDMNAAADEVSVSLDDTTENEADATTAEDTSSATVAGADTYMESAGAVNNGSLKSYTVREGDTLSKISMHLYGSHKRWPQLARVNQLANPDLVYPGQKISYVPSRASAVLGEDVKTEVVEVNPGDTLSSLSQRYYGTKSYWAALFNANRDTIVNPNVIYSGQKIVVVPKDRVANFLTKTGTHQGQMAH